jgi:hypothetical protein
MHGETRTSSSEQLEGVGGGGGGSGAVKSMEMRRELRTMSDRVMELIMVGGFGKSVNDFGVRESFGLFCCFVCKWL